MARNATWTNSDGLVVGFGTHTEDNDVVAVSGSGTHKTFYLEVVGTDLVDTIAVANLKPQSALIPRGSTITAASFKVVEAFTSGGSATLDIGLFGTSVVDDADGIDVDIALTAIDAIGDVVVCNGAVVGGVVAVGATANEDCHLTASYETAAFTAGKGILTVEVIVPSGSAGPSLAA
jgi:DUF1009 family protein